MLYLVSTPIGNLEDITYRAVRILALCDYILCEDTRKSKILLDYLSLKKELVSFHKFSEKQKQENILQDLENGKEIALISDSGTPIVCDPGKILVLECIKKNIKYTALPGACSVIDAFVLSAFDLPFQFVGFLNKTNLKKDLKKMLCYNGTTICFESPNRILKTLALIHELDSERELVLVRELTKKFEDILRGTPSSIINLLEGKTKGEMVLLIAKKDYDFKDIDLFEMLEILKESGLSSMEALKTAAKLRKEKKKDLYTKTREKLC